MLHLGNHGLDTLVSLSGLYRFDEIGNCPPRDLGMRRGVAALKDMGEMPPGRFVFAVHERVQPPCPRRNRGGQTRMRSPDRRLGRPMDRVPLPLQRSDERRDCASNSLHGGLVALKSNPIAFCSARPGILPASAPEIGERQWDDVRREASDPAERAGRFDATHEQVGSGRGAVEIPRDVRHDPQQVGVARWIGEYPFEVRHDDLRVFDGIGSGKDVEAPRLIPGPWHAVAHLLGGFRQGSVTGQERVPCGDGKQPQRDRRLSSHHRVDGRNR